MDWMKKDYVFMYYIYVYIYIIWIIAKLKKLGIEHMLEYIQWSYFLNLTMLPGAYFLHRNLEKRPPRFLVGILKKEDRSRVFRRKSTENVEMTDGRSIF